jgi:F420H(2)-dependent quinone reductase
VALKGEYAPLNTKQWIREQVEAWERSDGIDGTTLPDTGEPCVIMVNRGAKSGQLQRTPLIKVEFAGKYAAVGSGAGGPQNPAWVTNVRADPHVEVWDGPDRDDYTARELKGDERQDWWGRSVVAFPQYLEYKAATARVIPVFLLEPAPHRAGRRG